jgi:RNA polymerase sigma factor (sigma-70 family)
VKPEPPADVELLRTYRETVRPLYAYVSRRGGGDWTLAEDLVQDVWMRAIGAWMSSGIPRDPIAWLLTVAHHTIVSHYRRARPLTVDPAAVDLEAPSFSPDVPDTAAIVNWALTRVRRAHAELLETFYFDGKSVKQIAAERRMSERAVEGRLRRARQRLKRVLDRVRDTSRARAPGASRRSTDHAG